MGCIERIWRDGTAKIAIFSLCWSALIDDQTSDQSLFNYLMDTKTAKPVSGLHCHEKNKNSCAQMQP